MAALDAGVTLPQTPIPDRHKLAVTRIGAQYPFLVPLLAFGFATVTGQPAPPPFSPHDPREALRRLVARHSSLGRLISRIRSAPIAPPRPIPRDTRLAQRLTDSLRPAVPGQRSVVFLHHAYYHFYYLAAALRRRGWHALSVSFESPSSPNQPYYHGEDLSLWHDDYTIRVARMWEFFEAVAQNFRMLHWHGEAWAGIFDVNFQNMERDAIPWDFLALRRRGVKLGFSISGCMTGQSQTAVYQVAEGVCDKCPWQHEPLICSDAKNRAVGSMLSWICDLIAVEADWPTEIRTEANAYQEPLTYCLDEHLWRPDIEVPADMRLDRERPDEILIWHAMGNYDLRSVNGRNIKGTGAVVAAVERLRAEGIPARLVFKTGVPSRDMRFYQVQADIVVDQLNYGRYGATARECMMLGRPTVCYLRPEQPADVPPSRALAECPLVSANEDTVYDVLKDLCVSPERRRSIGEESLAYAVKWHSAAACAERFERVYDRIMAGQPLEDPRGPGQDPNCLPSSRLQRRAFWRASRYERSAG